MKCESWFSRMQGLIEESWGLENRSPFKVIEMKRDRKTASGEISKTERGRTERKRASLSAFLSEAEL